MSFHFKTAGEIPYLTSSLLGEVSHGFSTRKGGVSPAPWDSLNLGPSRGDHPAYVQENYRRFFAVLGLDIRRPVLSHQVHGTTVRICTAADAGCGLWQARRYDADALITNIPALPLVVFSADCGILLLYDPVTGAAGAIHAGWRGCTGGIVEKTVSELRRAFGTNPANLRAAIGPCIGSCCFETDDDVPDAMRAALGTAAEPYLERRGTKYHVDLAGLNRTWLLRAGLPAAHIDLCGLCTACRPDLFWSHRKMGIQRGVQTAVIACPEKETP